MHEHIVQSHDAEYQRLLAETLRMGEMAANQLDAALDAMRLRDATLARQVVANDPAIDALERDISHGVMTLALRGPMARDLRELLAALRIASDIERIGDYAANVAKRSAALQHIPPSAQAYGLHALGALAASQLRSVLAAYRDTDADAARQVRERDAAIDEAYTTLFRELLSRMMVDAPSIPASTHVLFMAKNIERIGDHATNIAENVWFLVHGDTPLPPREKRDASDSAIGL